MNGIDKIIERIDQDTRLETDELKAKAAQECEKIKSEAKDAAKNEYWRVLKDGAVAAEQVGERAKIASNLEVRKQLLALKQELVDTAFEQAAERITKLPEDKYVSFLAALAAEASRTGAEKIVLSGADKARVGNKTAEAANKMLVQQGKKGELTVSSETRDIRGGLILSDGNIEINCTVESILQLRRNELIGEVSKILFD